MPAVCQLAFGDVSSGQLTPTEIMLIAVIFFFLLEHNQQIIYFCSFITEPLLTGFLPFKDQKLERRWFALLLCILICSVKYELAITTTLVCHKEIMV